MNPTTRALIERYLAENPPAVVHLAWWAYALMWIGAFTVLVVALWGFFALVGVREARRNAKVLADPDIHPSIVCTCPVIGVGEVRPQSPKCPFHGYAAIYNSNHVGVLSISDFKRVDGDAS